MSGLPRSAQLYLIMGLDAFLEIDSWKSFQDLFRQAAFIVMTRPGTFDDLKHSKLQIIGNYLNKTVSADYAYSETDACFLHPRQKPVFAFKVTPIDISSSMIRDKVKKGLPIRGLVPRTVEDFIKTKGLYL